MEDLRALISLLELTNAYALCHAVVLCTTAFVVYPMFVQKFPYIIYRDYPSNGYLTDNRNFGYDTVSKSCLKVGDLMMSKEGSIFYSQLEYRLMPIEAIVEKLMIVFPEVSCHQLYNDAVSFYQLLASKGFVYCCDEEEMVYDSLSYFSYANKKSFILNQEMEISTTYEQIFGGQYSLTRVHVDVSSRCNERCVHCYIPSQHKCDLMSAETFDKVLYECEQMKVLNITLSGGEPMLNPNLGHFLQKCSQKNFSVNILSNLTILTDDLVDIIASNPLICVQTSLYAMEGEIHDSITGQKGSYRKTMDSIVRLHERNVPLQINCPIMKQNFMHYREVLEFASSLNIESSSDYALFGCYDGSGTNVSCRLSENEVRTLLERDFQDDNKLIEAKANIEQRKVSDEDPICFVCKSSLCVSNSGDVYPCEGWQRLILGNIWNRSLEDIWENDLQTKFLRELRYKDFDKCRDCGTRSYCTTCLVMNANDNSEMDYMRVSSYSCQMAEVRRSVLLRFR